MNDTNNIATIDSSRFLKNAVLLRLQFRCLGGSRKGSTDNVETEVDKARTSITIKIFDCKEYQAILSYYTKYVRDWVLKRAIKVDLGFKGTYVMPLGFLQDIESRLIDAEKEIAGLVDQFIEVLPKERDKAVSDLGPEFRESDYPVLSPEMIRQSFKMTWRYVTFQTPDALPPEILAREKKNLEESFAAMADDVQAALRETLSGLLSHLTAKLAPKEDGKMPIFRDSTINNLVEFLDLFDKRNVTNDVALAEMVTSAKKVIGNATPDYLRKNITAREAVRKEIQGINAAINTLIAEAPNKRRFDLSIDTEE